MCCICIGAIEILVCINPNKVAAYILIGWESRGGASYIRKWLQRSFSSPTLSTTILPTTPLTIGTLASDRGQSEPDYEGGPQCPLVQK